MSRLGEHLGKASGVMSVGEIVSDLRTALAQGATRPASFPTMTIP